MTPAASREHHQAASARPLFSWPLMVSSLVFLAALSSRQIFADADTFWHVATGRWILAHRAIPTVDVFAYTMTGAPWIAHEWGAQVIMAGVARVGGWGALHTLFAIAAALTVGVIGRFTAARMQPLHALILTCLASGMLFDHLLVRPHVLAWPIMACWIMSLMQAAESRQPPSWWLVLLVLCWANLHLSYVLGMAIACGIGVDAVWAETDSRARWKVALAWSRVLLTCALALMINPHGWHIVTYAVEVMGMTSLGLVSEWSSPDFHQPQMFLVWLVLVVPLAWSGLLRMPWPRTTVLLVMVYMALKHVRYVSLLGLVSPFVLASAFAQSWARRVSSTPHPDRLERWLARASQPMRTVGVVLSLLLLSVAAAARLHWPVTAPDAIVPARALAAARAHNVRGHVLNGYAFGGYLIAQGVPVYIDGRSDLYGDQFMDEARDAMNVVRSGALEAVLRKYNIQWTLLRPDAPSTQIMDYVPGWQRIYADSTAVVHVRTPPGAVARP